MIRRAALLVALAACPERTELPVCEGDPPPSVVVTLTDADGQPIPDPVVAFTVDDAPEAACVASDDPPTAFTCGENQQGSFTITADGYGFEPATAEVEVTRDGCFVATAQLPLVLERTPCPDRTAISVTVTVIDQATAAIPDAAVAYLPDDLGWTEPEACEKREARTFWCGNSVTGPIRLTTTAPGFATDTRTVTVREDFCGMIPETVTVVLYP